MAVARTNVVLVGNNRSQSILCRYFNKHRFLGLVHCSVGFGVAIVIKIGSLPIFMTRTAPSHVYLRVRVIYAGAAL